MARSIVAILGGAAMSAAMATVLLFGASALTGNPTDSSALPILLVGWICIAFIANAAAASTLGMVWRWVAEAKGWRASWQYFAPAALSGFALAFVFINAGALLSGEANLVWRWFRGMLPAYIYGAALGGLTGYFAWLIRRPDRDGAPNPPTSPS